MKKNLYIKEVCGTDSDPDDLWVYQNNNTSDELLLLKLLALELSDTTISIDFELNNKDNDVITFYDVVNNPNYLLEKYNVYNTSDLFKLFSGIRTLLEDISADYRVVNYIDTISIFYNYISSIILICSTYPNKEFYFE